MPTFRLLQNQALSTNSDSNDVALRKLADTVGGSCEKSSDHLRMKSKLERKL